MAYLRLIRTRSASEAGLLSGEVPMRTLYRILCVLTISTLMSGSALLAQAQQDDQYDDQPPAADQQYDQQDNTQNPVDQQAAPPDSRYDQNSNNDRDENQASQPDRVAPDPRYE